MCRTAELCVLILTFTQGQKNCTSNELYFNVVSHNIQGKNQTTDINCFVIRTCMAIVWLIDFLYVMFVLMVSQLTESVSSEFVETNICQW